MLVSKRKKLYLLRDLNSGELVFTYNNYSSPRKAFFASVRTAKQAIQKIEEYDKNLDLVVEEIN